MKDRKKATESWLLLIFIFAEALFFSTIALISAFTEFSTNTYVYYIGLISFLILVFFLSKLSFNKNYFAINHFVLFILLSVLTLAILLGYAINEKDYVLQIAKYFFIFSLPAVLLGVMISKDDIFKMYKNLRYVNIYISFCFTITLLANETTELEMFHNLGGASHLLIGYTMSALYIYNLLEFLNNEKRSVKIFSFTLMIFNIFIVILSGSRGALVSIMVLTIILFIFNFHKVKKVILFSILPFAAIFIYRVSLNIEQFDLAIRRITSITDISNDQSSQARLVFYDIALNGFKENPLLGNGIGSFSTEIGRYGYPHNIVLEIIYDFGLVGLFIAIITFVYLASKCLLIITLNYRYHYIVLLFLSSLIQLSFSGSYLINAQLWVSLAIIWTFHLKFQKKFNHDSLQRYKLANHS